MARGMVKAQLAMDERVVKDPELEAALEARLRAYDDAAEVRRVYEEKDEVAKGLLEKLELADGMVVRVGRFRVEKRFIPEKEVSFTSRSTSRLAIKLEE